VLHHLLADAAQVRRRGPASNRHRAVADRGSARVSGGEGISEALHASRLTTPTADAGIAYYELGDLRSVNVGVVLEWSSMGKPDGTGSWVWSTERLDLAASRATA
jgi:hypothetical protein